MPIGLFGLIVHGILGVRVFAIEWLIMVLIKFTWIPRLLQNCTSYRHFFYFQKIQLCFRIDEDVEIYFLFLFLIRF